jgi:hypothetical protein
MAKTVLELKKQERFPITMNYGRSAEKEQGIWMGRRVNTPKVSSVKGCYELGKIR